jgi:hypothetical protein
MMMFRGWVMMMLMMMMNDEEKCVVGKLPNIKANLQNANFFHQFFFHPKSAFQRC